MIYAEKIVTKLFHRKGKLLPKQFYGSNNFPGAAPEPEPQKNAGAPQPFFFIANCANLQMLLKMCKTVNSDANLLGKHSYSEEGELFSLEIYPLSSNVPKNYI